MSLLMFLLWFRPSFCSGGWGRGYFCFPPTCVSEVEVDKRKQHKQSGQLWPENVSGDLYLQKNERKTKGGVPRLLNSITDTKKCFLFFFCICVMFRLSSAQITSPDLIPVFLYLKQKVIKCGSISSDQSACSLCMFFTALRVTYVPNCALAVAPLGSVCSS